jgi:hypothetical protein
VSGSLLRSLWITASAALLVAACGGDDAPDADAGTGTSAELLILDPPGDSLGLPFRAEATMRVRYQTLAADPIAGADVTFSFLTGPTEDTGGAALSTTVATTDSSGIATATVTAGGERTNFRVRVTAAAAQPVTFYVTISDAGFTNLIVHARHDGWRSIDDFERVQVRLYRTDNVACGDIDFDEPPESVFPPRTMDAFGDASTFQNLGALEPYTVLAWGELLPDGTRVSAGCVTLGAGQVQPGRRAEIEAVVSDRPLELTDVANVSSKLDLSPVADAVRAAGGTRAWDVLRCPAGPGQLAIDCALDAAATTSGDATDCVLDEVAASSALATAVEGARGEVDEVGCRPATMLDQAVAGAVDAGGSFPTGVELIALLDARELIAGEVELQSRFAETSPGAGRHELVTVSYAGGLYDIDVAATARPIVVQSQIAIAIDAVQGVSVAPHGFTLRLGAAGHDAFAVLGLAPAGLGDRAADLGAAVYDSIDDGTDTGCAALSDMVCSAASQPSGCLLAGCAAAATNLDARLTDWTTALDRTGIDFTLEGTAPVYDFDDDLHIDALGTNELGEPTGTWTTTFTLADGTTVGATGTFGALGPEFE